MKRRFRLLFALVILTSGVVSCEPEISPTSTVRPTSTSTPLPTIPPTSTPQPTPSPEQIIQDTRALCLEIEADFPSAPIPGIVTRLLTLMDVQVVTEETPCDTTLSVTLSGEALGTSYISGNSSSFCYTGAEVDVQIVLQTAGGERTAFSADAQKPVTEGTIGSCPSESGAPWRSVWPKALLEGLAHLWGSQVFAQALRIESVRAAGEGALEDAGLAAREAVPTLIQVLGDSNEDARSAAARALEHVEPEVLASVADPDVVSLVQSLADEAWENRIVACWRLGLMEKEATEAGSALAQTLGDEESWVRSAAATSLGLIGANDDEAVTALGRALEDEKPWVREAAARALGRLGPAAADAVPALVHALGDESDAVRTASAEGLGLVGPEATLAIPALLQAREMGVSMSEEALERITGQQLGYSSLAWHQWWVRQGRPGMNEALPVVLSALEAKSVDRRGAAAGTLGWIGPEGIPALLEACKDGSALVRSAAATGLGRVGPAAAEAIPYLEQALGDEDRMVRIAAALALEQMGAEVQETVSTLFYALWEGNEDERTAAAQALGDIGRKADEAIPVLFWALRDNSSQARIAAVAALQEITGQRYVDNLSRWLAWWDEEGKPGADEAAPILIAALEDESAVVRSSAAAILAWMDPAD